MKKLIYALLLLTLVMAACKKDPAKENAEQIVKEWMGKTIVFPSDVPCSYLGKDTICPNSSAPYKILVYTDSIGCTACKLKLSIWNQYIYESDSIMPAKVEFLFYFQPKSEKELKFLLKRDKFDHTVYIDNKNRINGLNNFPTAMEYQCFLLDKDNKVILIGNPTLNPKIWELYKQRITDRKSEPLQLTTSVEVKQANIDMKDMKVGQKSTTEFILKNTSDKLLLITHVDASCGCTVPMWDKTPVKPGDETRIKVEVTPDKARYLNKTIDVFCNTANSPIRLTVKGEVKD